MTKNQCEAMTLASTYAAAHRCLKKGKKVGARRLCAHHQQQAGKESYATARAG